MIVNTPDHIDQLKVWAKAMTLFAPAPRHPQGAFSCRGAVAARGLRVIAAITLANSELLLGNVEASGYLDIELVYRLRPKKPVFGFEDLVRETLEAV